MRNRTRSALLCGQRNRNRRLQRMRRGGGARRSRGRHRRDSQSHRRGRTRMRTTRNRSRARRSRCTGRLGQRNFPAARNPDAARPRRPRRSQRPARSPHEPSSSSAPARSSTPTITGRRWSSVSAPTWLGSPMHAALTAASSTSARDALSGAFRSAGIRCAFRLGMRKGTATAPRRSIASGSSRGAGSRYFSNDARTGLDVCRAGIGRCVRGALAAAAAQLGRSPLWPRLARLSVPSLRGAPPARQAEGIGLPAAGPGSLQRDGKRVLVEVGFDHGAVAAAGAVRAAGGDLLNVSRRYQTATVAINPGQLPGLAALGAVDGVTEILAPLTFAPSECPSGVAVSEGDGQLRTAEARAHSASTAAESPSASSPTPITATRPRRRRRRRRRQRRPAGVSNPCGDTAAVEVLDDSEAEGADEGRAMAQVVHDLAPGAKLAFASAFTGETAFANNIERLAEPAASGGGEASVIADDVAYFDEPFFQDGPVAAAVNKTTAEESATLRRRQRQRPDRRQGRRFVAASVRAGRLPDGGRTTPRRRRSQCADFNGSGDTGFGITVAVKGKPTIDLQWAEPWYGVGTDIDAYLLDASNKVVAQSEYDNPGSTKKPFESSPGKTRVRVAGCDARDQALQRLGEPAGQVRDAGERRQRRAQRRVFGIDRVDRGRPDDLRPQRRRRGDQRSRRSVQQQQRAGVLLLAWPGRPLLWPGQRHRLRPEALVAPETFPSPTWPRPTAVRRPFRLSAPAGSGASAGPQRPRPTRLPSRR